MSRALLLVNPRSGEQEPTPTELIEEAERLGVEARELRRGDDAAGLARAAADAGAPAIGIAGGDGSLAAVAEVALERELPFVCIPFGTRNHFARDVGLDPDDPLGALPAFAGRERRVDVGRVSGRIFLNNVSLGIYASFVHDPGRKTRNRLLAGLRMLPAALGRTRRRLELAREIEGRLERHRALVVLVGNNAYELATLGDLGQRARLDEGLLHAYVIEAVGRMRLLALLARAAAGRLEGAAGWTEWASARFRVAFPRPRIPAAVDGEPVVLRSPLEFTIEAGALRILLPRDGAEASEGAG